jgi:hypothetical protein
LFYLLGIRLRSFSDGKKDSAGSVGFLELGATDILAASRVGNVLPAARLS